MGEFVFNEILTILQGKNMIVFKESAQKHFLEKFLTMVSVSKEKEHDISDHSCLNLDRMKNNSKNPEPKNSQILYERCPNEGAGLGSFPGKGHSESQHKCC